MVAAAALAGHLVDVRHICNPGFNMQAFTTITGKLAPLPAANIDTDVIMPKQFLKGIDRQGLDRGVFFDLRFLADGAPNPDFILNQPGWQNATFCWSAPTLAVAPAANMQCGAESAGHPRDYRHQLRRHFDDNCQRNGVLTLSLSEADYQRLRAVAADAQRNTISVSLEQQTIQFADEVIHFTVSALKREMLIGGGSAVDWTLQYEADISQFEAQHLRSVRGCSQGATMSEIIDRGPSPFIAGFTLQDVTLDNGVTLRVASGGKGTPLLMLHGHPQNHLARRKSHRSWRSIIR